MASSSVRQPAVAGRFYPAERRACEQAIAAAQASRGPRQTPTGLVMGGIAPHAGWTFCAPTIARVFAALPGEPQADCLVHFGAVHVAGVDRAAVAIAGAWQTPLGTIAVDEELSRALVDEHSDLFIADDRPHAHEHSLEVQVPFVQAMLGAGVRILPIMARPNEQAIDVGNAAAAVCARLGRRALCVGSTDLTHYGKNSYGWAPQGSGHEALRWVREQNDRRMIDLMLNMDAERIVPEARERRNACGAGAVAATIAFCRAIGATRGVLLDYTTSYDELPRGEPSDFVGYAGVAFEK